MVTDQKGSVPPSEAGVTFSGTTAAAEIRKVTHDINRLTSRLASVALFEAQKPDLVKAGDALLKATKQLEATIAELEPKEQFGGEASYKTVLRLFCKKEGRGRVFRLSEIWQHLALTYDMSAETYETLDETLAEWAADIEIDAPVIFQVKGKFNQIGDDGYKFVESLRPSKPASAKSSIVDTPQQPVPVPIVKSATTPERDEERKVLTATRLILAHGPVRQPAVRKALAGIIPDIDYDRSLLVLDNLVEKGILFRFRGSAPTKGAAWLSLDSEDVSRAGDAQDGQQDGKEPDRKEIKLNIPVAVATINTLLSKEKWNQRFTVQSIWASFDDATKDSVRGGESNRKREETGAKAVGAACQVLSRFGIIERGMFRIRSRGRREFKKRHRKSRDLGIFETVEFSRIRTIS